MDQAMLEDDSLFSFLANMAVFQIDILPCALTTLATCDCKDTSDRLIICGTVQVFSSPKILSTDFGVPAFCKNTPYLRITSCIIRHLPRLSRGSHHPPHDMQAGSGSLAVN